MEALMANKRRDSDYIGSGDNLGLPDKLAYLANYGDMFIAVVSKHNTETLSLAEHFKSSLNAPVCTLDNYKVGQGQLIDIVARGFGLEARSSLNSIGEFSENLVVIGQKPVILVINAHKMKDKVLRALFSIAERCHLGLVLFGSPRMLKGRGFKDFQNNIHICEIAKMDHQDLQSYIRRKHEDDVLVSSDQLDEILRQSEGSSHKVDRLVEDLLFAPKRRLGVSMMNMSVVVVMILLGIAYYGNSGFDLTNEEAADNRVVEKLGSLLTDTTENLSSAVEVEPEKGAEKLVQEAFTPEMASSELGNETTLEKAANTRVTAPKITAPKIIAPKSILPELAQALDLEPAEEIVPRSWLSNAAGTDYTLQIMGSSSEARIQEYIDAQATNEVFTYYKTRRGDQAWYVLTVGQYIDREAALAAISQLPANIQTQLPWARNVSSIRDVLVP